MRIFARIIIVLLVLVLILGVIAAGIGLWTVRRSFPQTDGTAQLVGLSANVEVIRDERGIPNIYADTQEDLFAALGYVHAQDRFYEMDFRRHVTSGRLSEMFGESQVDTDAFLRRLDWRGVAEIEYGQISAESRLALEAYADGINRFIAGRSGPEISLEYLVLSVQNPGYVIEQWDPVDSLAWLKALAWDLNGNYEKEVSRAIAAAKVGVARTEELYPPYPFERNGSIVGDAEEPKLAKRLTPAAANTRLTDQPKIKNALIRAADNAGNLRRALGPTGQGIGSNSWVISGALTQTGAPLLANDPHLAASMPSTWYQAGLRCREVSELCPYDVTGWTMSGVPGVFIGHNQSIAWGLTNLGPDVSDLALERVKGKKYLLDEKRRPILTRKETIKVADAPDVEIKVRSTGNGPIISDLPGVDVYAQVGETAPVPAPGQSKKASRQPRGEGYAVSLKWTALTPRPTYDAILSVNRATNWEEFRAAATQLSVPSQNLVYADTEGTIGYQAPGVIPVRQGYDGRWPFPGWDSSFDWSGNIPFEELPSITNPPAGWVTTANQQVVPLDGSPKLKADPTSYGSRANRINERIAAVVSGGGKLTATDMQSIQLDAGNELAEFLVPRLQRISVDSQTAQAVKLLEDWDYQQTVDSAAGAYFNVFYRQLLQLMFFDELGTTNQSGVDAGDRTWEAIRNLWEEPRNAWWDDVNKSGKQRRNNTVAAALQAANRELRREQGDDPTQWSWGELHQVEARNASLGESGIEIIERVFNRGPLPVGGGSSIPLANGWNPVDGYEVSWIPSMRQVVDLGDFDRSSWVNFTGNSGHTYNENYVDQFDAWAQGGQYPWPFSREAVVSSGTNTLILSPRASG